MSTPTPGDVEQTRTSGPDADAPSDDPGETRQLSPEGDESGKEEAGYGYGV